MNLSSADIPSGGGAIVNSIVAFGGDSRFAYTLDTVRIANGGPVFPESGDLLINRYQTGFRTIYNKAFPGWKSTDVFNNISQITALNPTKVILQVGTADMFNHNDNQFPTRQSAWQGIFTALAAVPLIVVTECINLRQDQYTVWNYNLLAQQQYNASLKAFCLTIPHVIWVDTNKYFVDSNQYLLDQYTWDGVHPNYAGYQQMWKAIDYVTFL